MVGAEGVVQCLKILNSNLLIKKCVKRFTWMCRFFW